MTYRVASKYSKVELSTNDMTIHVGQTVYISLADDSVDPGAVRWMTSSLLPQKIFETEFFDRTGKKSSLGMKLTALIPGKTYYEIVPDYGDWNRATKFYITVIP